ncbi:MAG: YdiU family protein [Burkholderiales bacterium]|nr:YdiU family protein [Burkholderiales bacterium]
MNAPVLRPAPATASLPLADWPELRFDNSYARLPPEFYMRLAPTPLPAPRLVAVSHETARLLGLDEARLSSPEFAECFIGNRLPAGADPLAAVYAGHQFGVWAGRLGDGRALLLGEIAGPTGNWEVQLKGAGRTPYSRGADGRAVLRSSIREFLCSEAMHALGVPSTRALAIVASDAPVFRETVETAAVVTRLSPSFVRFGTFEYFYAADRPDLLRVLADYVIGRFYPELAQAANPYLALLGEVMRRTARLVARWQSLGFCHGVMNTDNMSVLGLTIDYGPFGFLDGFDANHICNHSDDSGRYSYAMQPRIAEWNCWCLGQALMPLIAERGGSAEDAQAVLGGWQAEFGPALEAALRAKLGLAERHDDDAALLDALFERLQADRVDFTLFFRYLADVRRTGPDGATACRDLVIDRAAFDAWLARYRARLVLEARPDAERAIAMKRVNPKYVLRNHLAETAIRQAREGDFSEVRRLLKVLEHPYDDQPQSQSYAALPPDWAAGLEVSCSS